jgi:hypothetical protein
MTAEATQGRSVAEWMRVLDEIEQSLAGRLAETPEPPPVHAPRETPSAAPLQALDGRLAQLQGRLDQAERDAAEAEVVLRSEAEAHQQWTDRMMAARRRLADWAAGRK